MAWALTYTALAQRAMAQFVSAPAQDPQAPRDPLGAEGREQPLLAGVSSFPEEVLAGTSVAPALEGNRVLQKLLRVAQGLGIQA